MGTQGLTQRSATGGVRGTYARTASQNVTLAHVAKAAGVAPMTVSRYLNRHPNVTPKTARKVRAAIEKLNYAPNHAARMLMGQPSNVIGLIVPTLNNPFFATVAQSVEAMARARGYLVWIASSNSDVETEAELISQMKQHRVDGLLLVPASGASTSHINSGPGATPMVMIDRQVAGVEGLNSVVVENRRGAREAMEHLIGHGYKRIACIGANPGLSNVDERVAGYEDALRRHGLKPLLRLDCVDEATTHQRVQELLTSSRVQAIFTLNNNATKNTLQALSDLGVSCPDTVALVGFDDFELAATLRPRITVVRQPSDEVGRRAAKLLFERLGSTEETPVASVVLPTQLVIRESCGCKHREMAQEVAA